MLVGGPLAAEGAQRDSAAPFLILCALTLMALVGAPIAAAAALRRMSE